MYNKNRIYAIDEFRGLCIICVVIYHLFYTGATVFNLPWFQGIFPSLKTFQPILPIAFIIISGLSFNLSHDNTKRSSKLLAIAVAITLITAIFIPSQIIWFGIIHFLGVANFICSQSKWLISKIPFWLGIIISALLFVATYSVSKGYLGIPPFTVDVPSIFYSTDAVMLLGVHSKSFYSADYTPLLPWFFLFTTAVFAGRHLHKLPKFLKKRHIRPLAFIGRHTLIIYIVHQPIIFGILYTLTRIF